MDFITAYKKASKPAAIEEWIDLFFFRPLAFLFVYPADRLGLHPNYFTLLSIISGVGSIALVLFNFPFWAGIAFFITIVLDCCDGQLARLGNKSSQFGAIMDQISDFLVEGLLVFACGFSLYSIDSNWLTLLYFLAADLTLAAQMMFWDFNYVRYSEIVLQKGNDFRESSHCIQPIHKKQKGLARLFLLGYVLFFRISCWLINILFLTDDKDKTLEKNKQLKPEEAAALYKKYFRLPLRLWSFLGPSSHFTPMIIFMLINRLDFLPFYFIVILNSWLLLCIIIQNIAHFYYCRALNQKILSLRNK